MASNDVERPFRAVARSLMENEPRFLTHTDNINWMAAANELEGVHYETLRKAVTGERFPSVDLMERLAALVKVDPSVFSEYRLHLARRQFDVKEVGFEQAMENLRGWAEQSTVRPKKPRR